ncbi:hypothetical protein [Bacillus fungorum]|nr:hypothetical protein [Bacillus fungorum]
MDMKKMIETIEATKVFFSCFHRFFMLPLSEFFIGRESDGMDLFYYY